MGQFVLLYEFVRSVLFKRMVHVFISLSLCRLIRTWVILGCDLMVFKILLPDITQFIRGFFVCCGIVILRVLCESRKYFFFTKFRSKPNDCTLHVDCSLLLLQKCEFESNLWTCREDRVACVWPIYSVYFIVYKTLQSGGLIVPRSGEHFT